MTLSDPPAQLRLLEELPPVVEPPLPRLAVTGLVSYARCPRQCYWDVVERRPRPLRPAARIGSLVHGWIEREAAGQGSLLAASAEPDPWIAELKAAFLASPWARRRPRSVERPFVLSAGATTVRGRVDAVYDMEEGSLPRGRQVKLPSGLEIVDFKTGRRPAADDAAAGFQLSLYALAAVDCWGREPESLRTTEWYVREGAGVTQDWDRAAVDAVRARLAAVLDGVAAGRFGPVPGSYCGRCAHVAACPEGQAATVDP
ncbi:MAG TPA: PD-(D/E)XK nuclease family protein [Acidimicrobiia bacterium]|nr:PD-(D/E)XK nuclease family protein [Acidimicrobiia bacterium]